MLAPQGLQAATSPSRLTLVLDLDETLVHCEIGDGASELKGCWGEHGTKPLARIHTRPPELEFSLPIADESTVVRVYKRPNVDNFLAAVSVFCDVVIFTSAMGEYARCLARLLDPSSTIFKAILSREQCMEMEPGFYSKDLALLGRPLERTVLIDDSKASFLMQPSNGIPIPPFFGAPRDAILLGLLPILAELNLMPDIRPRLRNDYKLKDKLLLLMHLRNFNVTREHSPELYDSPPLREYLLKSEAGAKYNYKL